ncbi:HlyD family secretion protein [Lacticaseibacillus paracasei]|nr:HlyD family secretion protein [Lacticaseibacillus paracasei]
MNKGRSKGKRISQRMVIIGIGALAMIGVTVFFLVTSKKPTSSPAPTTIATFQVKKHELRVPGQVQAVRTQKIDIPEGTVQNMTVKNGDSVTLDQQLLTVYKPDVQAKIDEASRTLEKQQRSQATLDQQISQIKATLSKTGSSSSRVDRSFVKHLGLNWSRCFYYAAALLLLALNQTRSRNIRLMKLFQFV